MAETGQTARKNARGGMAAVCLFEAEGVRLLHGPARSGYALVLFGDDPSGARLRRNWVRGPGHAPVDCYEVLPRRAGVYPADQMRALCQVIADTNNRPAIALGAGMGGQAALRHGGQAGCAVALAFSPIGIVPSGDPALGPDLMPETLPHRALVAYDPEQVEDALQVEALRLLDGVQAVPLPFIGHRTEQTLIGDAVAQHVFAAALRGDSGAAARLLRHNRAHDDGFLARLSLACSRHGHFRWAADIAAKGHPERRNKPEMAIARAEAEAGLGRPIKAIETLEGLIVAAPQSLRYWTLLADRYEAMGQDVAVTEVLELALSVTENFGFCRRLIRKLAGLNGKARLQAHALAEMAMEEWPERRAQIAHLLKAMQEPA